MNGSIKLFFFFLMFSLIGCKSYYFLKEKKIESDNSNYTEFQLSFDNNKQKLNFYTYGDYEYSTINKKYIFFKNPEMRKLLRYKFSLLPTEQFLFIYNDQPTFANILAFYYKNASLAQIKNAFINIPHKESNNNLFYRYNFGRFQVFDYYKNVQDGVIRFVSINNPNYQEDPDFKSFDREIKTIFFKANTQLWEGYIQPDNY